MAGKRKGGKTDKPEPPPDTGGIVAKYMPTPESGTYFARVLRTTIGKPKAKPAPKRKAAKRKRK